MNVVKIKVPLEKPGSNVKNIKFQNACIRKTKERKDICLKQKQKIKL